LWFFIAGVPFNYLLTRGQQIKVCKTLCMFIRVWIECGVLGKVVSQLFRKAREVGLLIPNMNVESMFALSESKNVCVLKNDFRKT
jgi:hypothetical protein